MPAHRARATVALASSVLLAGVTVAAIAQHTFLLAATAVIVGFTGLTLLLKRQTTRRAPTLTCELTYRHAVGCLLGGVFALAAHPHLPAALTFALIGLALGGLYVAYRPARDTPAPSPPGAGRPTPTPNTEEDTP